MICAGDGATAFQGAGVSTGDVIGLPNAEGIDADGDIIRLAFDNYTFGGTGKGHISLVNSGADTIVRVNLDDDAAQEYQIQIKDGAVLASSYTVDDFSF